MKKITTIDTCIILATEDYYLSDLDFTPWANTYIFANHCILSGSKIKTKNLQLHTSSFLVKAADGKIDASGEDGKENVKESDKTANGHAGYSVFFSSACWYPDKPMLLSARGGNGGSGWFGKAVGKNGGKGGDGGPGGSVFLLYSDTFQLVNAAAGGWFSEKNELEKKAKIADWIKYCKVMITYPKSLVDSINRYTERYQTMSSDEAHRALLQLTESISSASVNFRNGVRVDYAGGLYGHGGSGTPKDGANGENGTIGSSNTVEMYNATIPSAPHILFHPDQIAMTLRDIENDYFLGSEDSIVKCARSLRTMVDRLSFFPALKPTDPLFQAYQKEEGMLFILPSKTDTPTSISSINKSLAKAQSYLRQISLGLDFYGHAPAWVPRGSYKFYKKHLEEVLVGLVEIETNYMVFKQEATAQAKKRDIIKHGVTTATEVINRTRQDIDRIKEELELVSTMIQGLPTDFKAKRELLVNLIKGAGDKIRQHRYKISLIDFLKAAAQFAFNPGLDSVEELIKVIAAGATELEDDDGDRVNKALLVKKVRIYAFDLSS